MAFYYSRPPARMSYFPCIIKTRGQQIALNFVKSTDEIQSMLHNMYVANESDRRVDAACSVLHFAIRKRDRVVGGLPQEFFRKYARTVYRITDLNISF